MINLKDQKIKMLIFQSLRPKWTKKIKIKQANIILILNNKLIWKSCGLIL